MKKYAKWLAALAVVCAVLVYPINDSHAALTKTAAFTVVDNWNAQGAATMEIGTPYDLSGSFGNALLVIEIAYTDVQAQAGVDIIVEISYATDELWAPLPGGTITTLGGTAVADDLDEGGGTAPGDGTVTLTDATGFDTVGQVWFIIDTTLADSEVVRTVSEAGEVVTLAEGMKNAHADAEVTWSIVRQHTFSIPFAAAFVRVSYNNTDADSDIHYHSRILEVTAIQ